MGRFLNNKAARIDLEREKVTVLADEAVRGMAYGPDNPLSATERSEIIRSFTPGSLSAFHFSRLDPQNIHVFFSGRISEKMIETVSQVFSKFPASNPVSFTKLTFPVSLPQKRLIHVERPHSSQSAIKMMIPAVGRNHPDFVALRSAVTALGGYFGSRLMLNIREEKGLTYGISAVLLGYPDRSFISISTQTDASTVDEVISLVIKELESMKDPDTYTNDEIGRLSRLLLSNLATILDTPFSRMDFHQTHIYSDTPADYFDSQEETARKLSPKLLAGIAEKYFDTSKLLTATAGL